MTTKVSHRIFKFCLTFIALLGILSVILYPAMSVQAGSASKCLDAGKGDTITLNDRLVKGSWYMLTLTATPASIKQAILARRGINFKAYVGSQRVKQGNIPTVYGVSARPSLPFKAPSNGALWVTLENLTNGRVCVTAHLIQTF